MRYFLSNDNALGLEYLVRRVFDTERGGVMNVANADQLVHNPLLAPIAIFSPLYLNNKSYPDIEEFMDKYCDFKYCEDPSELPDGYQDNFMSDLEVLVNKYYPKD